MSAVIAEYLWVDASGDVRSKSRVLPLPKGKKSLGINDLPDWNFDGSSTGQAAGHDSEVIIKPAAIYPDPFRGAPHLLVLTDTYDPKGKPLETNNRVYAKRQFDQAKKEEPWFGIEQEYTLFKNGRPLGWPSSKMKAFANGSPTANLGFPGPQGPYYCAAGADVTFGRDIIEEHLQMCIAAGLQISGINAEVLPGQWEYQVGPCTGIDAGDQLWTSRYLLARVCEKHGVVASFLPKPIPGDWNGSGCHTNYSTKAMRQSKGFKKAILPAIEQLEKRHDEHIRLYGEGNEARLTGAHETASIDTFKWGVADRGASIRVGNETAQAGKGYLEDRRPASNMCPYIVTGMLFETTVVKAGKKSSGMFGLRFSKSRKASTGPVGPRSSLRRMVGSDK